VGDGRREPRSSQAEVDFRVHTLERLAGWKAVGTITDAQYDTLAALVRRERVSVYFELSALLYLGVLSFVGGLAWTMRAYVVNLGDAAILTGLTVIVAATFYYCFAKAAPYANTEVEAPHLSLDYVLYLGCLVLSAEITYVEYRFHIFGDWQHHLLIVSLIFRALAYRFDNRFVLSPALSSVARWLGVRISRSAIVSPDPLAITALAHRTLVPAATLSMRHRAHAGADVVGAVKLRGGPWGLSYLFVSRLTSGCRRSLFADGVAGYC